ncbi:MAG TPA: porin [Opitutus sp.]|nr:porin [Opitutus sp.]
MNLFRSAPRAALILAFALPGLFAAEAQSRDDDIQALREQIRLLDQKLRVLERNQELKDEAATAAAKAAPKVTINDKGFTLASGDSANSIRLRGLVQLDARLFFGDDGAARDAFVLRRARLISEGVLAKNFGFQFVTEFGGSSVSILDANLTVALSKTTQLKFGKFKAPVGLEQLQSDTWTFFNERSIVTNLVPNRDLGIQISGKLLGDTVEYALGVFNGLPDGGSSNNTDFDNDKDVVARVFATPFKDETESPLSGLSFGVAGSIGRQESASGRTGGFRTDGQQTFFSYNAATVADGQTWRVSPQVDYRHGPFGFIGEYVLSTINVRPSATGAKTELQNEAWQLAFGYVLTGENSSYSGVVPKSDFNLSAGTWGAFEVVARVAQLDVDDAAFPVFASPATSANEASSFGVGLNWYLSKAAMLKLDYYQTDFGFNAVAPAVSNTPFLRQDEQTFITRFQIGF